MAYNKSKPLFLTHGFVYKKVFLKIGTTPIDKSTPNTSPLWRLRVGDYPETKVRLKIEGDKNGGVGGRGGTEEGRGGERL